jgi:hypothetical protein
MAKAWTQIGALLTGYEEVPSVSTTASGEFTATVSPDGSTMDYTETYSGLQAPMTQSHIHVGQPAVNGSIVAGRSDSRANLRPPSRSEVGGYAVSVRQNPLRENKNPVLSSL